MRPTDAEIVRHYDQEGTEGDAYVPGYVPTRTPIAIEEHDPKWMSTYDVVIELISGALGSRALELHHIGSTSVPGLPAKPIIDIDLIVEDPADESNYLPELLNLGFIHAVREPWWHQHRLVMLRQSERTAHVHIFGPDCPEVIRHVMFRDWLRTHPDDCELYANAKRSAAGATNAEVGTGMDYNRRKECVVRDIYDRMFRAHGLMT